MRKAATGLVIVLAALMPTAASAQSGDCGGSSALTRSLRDDPDAPVIGNPRGRDVIVEFFDYRCPYCRAFEPVLRRFLAEDGEARLVLEEWPIFGGASDYAARVALAARWQGRFRRAHDALLDARGTLDRRRVREIAEGAGVDLARLDRDMRERRDEIDGALRHVALAAARLHLKGTPAMVIGRRVIWGSLTLDDLESLFAQPRDAPAEAARDPR
jgi:protein-disulfide isomerase